MDKESVERLRFDRRLKTRDGWVEAAKEEDYLASLPDVTEKMTTCAAEEDAADAAAEVAAEEAAAPAPQPTPELQPQTPAPVAGDFSTSRAYTSDPETSASDALPDQGSAGSFRSEGGFGSDSNSD